MRPRGDDLDDLMALVQPVAFGDIHAQLYPDDVAIQTDEEVEAWRADLREREARRRPIGFTAEWPADVPLRRVV